ncbi:hypothetical protein RRG08_060665 [Elysia crispata]|uniref:Uncharacterized protein n=1 Tax=Elysia crispata TaxID=231223 RepID=A0AAE1AUD0_9GAST|nr:hypothetical protein RRG08_060665 [Elysia crispata]
MRLSCVDCVERVGGVFTTKPGQSGHSRTRAQPMPGAASTTGLAAPVFGHSAGQLQEMARMRNDLQRV